MGVTILKAFAVGFGAFLALLLVVFATGATFGQRCAKAYTDPVQIEDCVIRLNSGGRVYLLQQAEEGK